MRRPATAAALVLLLAGSCSDGSDDDARTQRMELRQEKREERSGGGAPTTVPQGRPPASGGTPASPSTTPPGGGGGDSGGGDGGGGGGGGHSGRTGPAATVAPVAVDDEAQVGAMGASLLSPSVPGAVVEIDRNEGESLAGQAVDALAARLREHGGKSVSQAAGEVVPARDVWTLDQLRQTAAAARDTHSTSERVSVYVLVLSGRFQDDGVVGVAFSATAFAVFPEQLGGGIIGLNRSAYEEAVTVHELGHLFGLVNLTGHGAFHEDTEHRGHSANSGSVMYWAVESTLVGDVFEGGPPRQFDADDRQEMQRIRASGGI